MIYFFIGVVVIIISSFSTLQVEIKIKINNKANDSFFIIRFFGGLIRLRFNLTLASLEKGAFSLILKKTDSDCEHYATLEEVFGFFIKNPMKYTKFANDIKHLASKTTIQKLNVDVKFGLYDAAQTALVYGSIITILSSLKGYLINKFDLKASKINLLPCFNERRLDMVLDCIINIRLGHIIITGIRMLLHSIKGGDISGRTSY